MSPLERFWSKVEKQDDGCWVWIGGLFNTGYGCFSFSGKNKAAYRWLYELAVGPVPDGLQLDHLCRNRACVRPSHLEPVTCQENLLRGETLAALQAAKTHCPQGHPYNDENTYQTPSGSRACRECRRTRSREYQRRRRQS